MGSSSAPASSSPGQIVGYIECDEIGPPKQAHYNILYRYSLSLVQKMGETIKLLSFSLIEKERKKDKNRCSSFSAMNFQLRDFSRTTFFFFFLTEQTSYSMHFFKYIYLYTYTRVVLCSSTLLVRLSLKRIVMCRNQKKDVSTYIRNGSVISSPQI